MNVSQRTCTALAWALLAAALLASGVPRLAGAVRPDARWDVLAVELVPAATVGTPLVAFVDASCRACRDPLLQLRVCPIGVSDHPSSAASELACDVAARREPAEAGVTRLRYARPLEAGAYRVEVLFLARDAIGALRTVSRVERSVDVR